MSRKKRADPRARAGRDARLGRPRGAAPTRFIGAHADLWIALGLTLLAWAHRLLFLRSNRDWDWPFTIFYEGDSETFYRYARALLAGELYDGGIPFHPPGFAWVLATIHALVGAGAADAKVPFFAVKALVALLGSASIGLLYAVARPYVGRLAALGGALLSLYAFGLYVLHVAPVTEAVWQALLLLCLLTWSRKLDHPWSVPGPTPRRPGAGFALLLGFLLGLLALVRAEGSLVGAVLGGIGLAGAWKGRRDRPLASALRPWALVLLGWVLIVAPWTIRNAVRLSAVNAQHGAAEPLPTFVPITIYGPINLALANHAGADGTFSRARMASAAQAGVLDLRDPEHLRFLLHGGEMARTWIAENPGAFARLVLRKWARFFGAWRLGWTQWNWPGGLAGTRAPVDVFLPDGRGALWLGPPLALLGLTLCLATQGGPRRWAILVLLLTGVGLAATGLFFGYTRQGLLYLPFWNTLSAAALVALAEILRRAVARLRGKAENGERPLLPSSAATLPPRALQIFGALTLALLALELWGSTADRNYQATGQNVAGATYLNRDDPVRLEVLPAAP